MQQNFHIKTYPHHSPYLRDVVLLTTTLVGLPVITHPHLEATGVL